MESNDYVIKGNDLFNPDVIVRACPEWLEESINQSDSEQGKR